MVRRTMAMRDTGAYSVRRLSRAVDGFALCVNAKGAHGAANLGICPRTGVLAHDMPRKCHGFWLPRCVGRASPQQEKPFHKGAGFLELRWRFRQVGGTRSNPPVGGVAERRASVRRFATSPYTRQGACPRGSRHLGRCARSILSPTSDGVQGSGSPRKPVRQMF